MMGIEKFGQTIFGDMIALGRLLRLIDIDIIHIELEKMHGRRGRGERKREVNHMTQWKCSSCGYTFGADAVPDRCPSCKQACTFSDVTCYIPDCGGTGNVDPRLVGKKDKPINE